jgi:benzil reductase ((S)-benzoin forming)
MNKPTLSAAIVTGHSRGLGEAVAAELLARGIAVLGLSRSRNAGLSGRFGAGLSEVEMDIADAATLESWLASRALATFLDGRRQALLVNNAGLLQPVGPLEAQEPGAVWRAVAVNAGAALTLSAAFALRARNVPDRRILHVSSGAGRNAYAGWSVYCASKAALDHHARAVALDATPGLRIASVAPGVIDTAMQAEIRATEADLFPDRERFVRMKREGTLRTPHDAARALVDLLLSTSFGTDPVTETRR